MQEEPQEETYEESARKAIAFYKEAGYEASRLPCSDCIFEKDDTTESGYVWLTCTAGFRDDDGCNWGNI